MISDWNEEEIAYLQVVSLKKIYITILLSNNDETYQSECVSEWKILIDGLSVKSWLWIANSLINF